MRKILFFTLISVSLSLSACGDPYKKQFMEGCALGVDGAVEKTCSCIYDMVEEYYGETRMKAIAKNPYPPDDFMEIMLKSTAICKTKYE